MKKHKEKIYSLADKEKVNTNSKEELNKGKNFKGIKHKFPIASIYWLTNFEKKNV